MHILVAGGAGYIGSVMAETLLEQGHAVTVYDNLSHGYRDAVPAAAAFVEGDVADQATVERVLRAQRIEAVIHMAAFIEVGESVAAPAKYLDNNLLRGVGLLEAMRAAGVGRLVLSSTAAVYAPSAQALTERSALAPASPYGLSKLYLERLLAWYASRGLCYYALRYFNAAGASAERGERHQPESHLIPLVLEAAAGEREAIQIFGTDYDTPDGTCVRDYIHVRDLADAHLLALQLLEREAAGIGLAATRARSAEGASTLPGPDSAGAIPELAERAMNLGNGRGFSVREVIAAAERVCGHAIAVRERPRRPGDADRLVADAAKMRALGWQPRHDALDEIIASAWRWKQRRASTLK